MKYDELVEHLGEFGPYQRRVFVFSCLPAVLCFMDVVTPIFLMNVPKFRCAIPGLANDTYETQGEWHQQLINYTLPWTNAVDDDDSIWGSAQCSVYKNRTTSNYNDFLATQSNETTACNRWVYDTSTFQNTFATQEDLVCHNSLLPTHATMIYMSGLLLGSLVFGFLSDRLGRKTSTMIGLVVHTVTNIATSFSTSFAVFTALRFVTGIANSGVIICCLVIATELVSTKWRTQAGLGINFFWVFGLFTFDCIAYLVRDWQHLQSIISYSSFIILVLFYFVPESPRWQLNQGQVEKARATLAKAAKVNGKELPPGAFVDFLEHDNEKNGKFIDIFKFPVLLIRWVVVLLNWVVVTAVYFGLTLNVGSLSGSVYVNFALTSAVESLSTIVTLLALDRVGRKPFHCFCMFLGGTACLACIIPLLTGGTAPLWVILILSNIGKFGISAAFNTVYFFTVELFPTALRNSMLGTCFAGARIGGIAAPYIADLVVLAGGELGAVLPYIVFGAATLLVGFLALILPETLNMSIPETLEDSLNIRKNSSQTYDEFEDIEQKDRKGSQGVSTITS